MGRTNSNNSGNVDRKATKGNQRSKSTIQRLNMLNSGKAIRNRDGKVVGGYLMMGNTAGNKKITGQARIAPDRRWFGNTRVIAQTELDSLREKVTATSNDPYAFILRRKKIPMALLQESEKVAKMNILETESFDSVFSKKGQRKRPKLSSAITDYESLMQDVEKKVSDAKDMTFVTGTGGGGDNGFALVGNEDGSQDIRSDDMFAKGQSKRIWGELYKVLDCSDVVIMVIDARNIPGTRCYHVEKHLKKNASHKQVICVLNKCDLIPSWATRKWVKILSQHFPTVAFHASMTKAFGKGALITLLRQYSKLHSVRFLSVLFVLLAINCFWTRMSHRMFVSFCFRTSGRFPSVLLVIPTLESPPSSTRSKVRSSGSYPSTDHGSLSYCFFHSSLR